MLCFSGDHSESESGVRRGCVEERHEHEGTEVRVHVLLHGQCHNNRALPARRHRPIHRRVSSNVQRYTTVMILINATKQF